MTTCYAAIIQDYEITDGWSIQRKILRTVDKFPVCKMVEPVIFFQRIEGGRFRIDVKWYVPGPPPKPTLRVIEGDLAA